MASNRRTLGFELITPCIKRVGYVFQEQESKHDVLGLCGVNLTAQGVSRFSKRVRVGDFVVVGHICSY